MEMPWGAVSAGGWEPFLRLWSEEWVRAHDHEPEAGRPLEPEVRRRQWLGFEPATAEQLAAAEARLGRTLPPSLRTFLEVTNGWRDAGCFIYELAGTETLEWLADTPDAHWITAYAWADEDPAEGEAGLLRRSLRLSLSGDVAVMFLDPDDVDDRGEWAAYWLSSWSGEGPRRFGSFAALLYDQYASFHALRRPPGATRDHWDATVETARLAALDGEVANALTLLEEAQRFGRPRAGLLRAQLLGMRGRWYEARVGDLVHPRNAVDGLFESPLFTEELLPLICFEERLPNSTGNRGLRALRRLGPPQINELADAYLDGSRQPTFGNPEFDTAVRRILDRLLAEPAFQVPEPEPVSDAVVVRRSSGIKGAGAPLSPFERQRAAREEQKRLAAAAWPDLAAALELWRPRTADHVAPIALYSHPVLATLLQHGPSRTK
ncbi:SMI1/KNR4 family protein [Actinacidiphila guanduensis]|nr:SMI1/KNR4 family protein [Actinacidiphila guanduensis]